ncbi:MAG: hypothetical protein J7L96_10060 [Bacteroidales bacterium]|nr:hypothetical protein [Bacteroidales bacterium]
MIIQTQSYPRAAIIGNPSDGYHGKTIAFVFSNFSAQVILYETPELEIEPAALDLSIFPDIKSLANHVNYSGYYGGVRLLKAMIKTFYDYCVDEKINLPDKNFTIRYFSDIPQRLGLAGSSAIITAGLKAMMQFYEVTIPPHILANLILSVEIDELGISAGLQDRVAQAYEHPVFMDFDKNFMDEHGFGKYTLIDPASLPNFYIAYKRDQSEGSEITHNDLRTRYNQGEPAVLKAIGEWSSLSSQMKSAIESGNSGAIPDLINRNYNLREALLHVKKEYVSMVKIARKIGASAKFTGSGGAIIGTYENDIMYQVMKIKFKKHGMTLIKPKIVTNKNAEGTSVSN